MTTTLEKIEAIHKHYGDTAPIASLSTFAWGLLSRVQQHGWLWLDDNGNHWTIYLANGKKSHSLYGTAWGVDICKYSGMLKSENGLTGAWKTALSLWPVRDANKAQEVYSRILGKIDQVYQRLPAEIQRSLPSS